MSTLLFRKPRHEAAAVSQRVAIIDIGSNSVRLVVYQGAARLPAILLNEKVMAGLGRSLGETGAIDAASMKAAVLALARFAGLARELGVDDLRVVATAAVREASNGSELLAAARKLGLEVELLSGVEEATAAGMGVLSAIPDADGIVGDLGGGSLELVRVVAGTVTDRVSFPLGVLRIAKIRAKGTHALDRAVAKLMGEAGWEGRGEGLPFYMVGGSWRSLARLDMHFTGYPLPVVHQYSMTRERVGRLVRTLGGTDKAKLRTIPRLSKDRLPTMSDAAALLASVLRHLGSEETVVSAYGLREGLLFSRLSPAQRREDPLIAAAREEGQALGRFPEHGDLLNDWVAPLFADEPPELERLRHAACLLADVGWRANPDFRAERGIETALHGNWVAIDAAGRALLAQALFTALGGGSEASVPLGELANAESLDRARRWGMAIRLAQRLSGGVAGPLKRSTVRVEGKALLLCLDAADTALYGESVERRHKVLAEAFGLEARLA
ncbi:Ppx/GppA family phosphatase [Sphingomonas sp.]|uniref:Ppx/GppA family phosphatase n=1 Tax=Sphingomonas sp. TaxID=28214 RepID=UPI001B19FEA3|nr:Ppx/GppA family phosphatase [Sphingomonas sp.]MBO9711878.1 Ppx/GppA family phosphatase [Sphingomonas sp.]